MDEPRVVLTNDDGIDSAGLRAMHDALSAAADVVTVAPAADRSAAGRSLSESVTVLDHELGYAVEGTPADCAVVGLEVLCPGADVLVAGCNEGANIGAYTLGRSGTVSAAVEAAFLGVPAIAASMYVPDGADWRETTADPASYRDAVGATAYLIEEGLGAGVFDRADYLNVNARVAGGDPAPMAVTRPSGLYEVTADRDDGTVTIRDRIWDRMREGSLPDPPGTDRRAVFEGRVSVSPLTAPHTVEGTTVLEELAAGYG